MVIKISKTSLVKDSLKYLFCHTILESDLEVIWGIHTMICPNGGIYVIYHYWVNSKLQIVLVKSTYENSLTQNYTLYATVKNIISLACYIPLSFTDRRKQRCLI